MAGLSNAMAAGDARCPIDPRAAAFRQLRNRPLHSLQGKAWEPAPGVPLDCSQSSRDQMRAFLGLGPSQQAMPKPANKAGEQEAAKLVAEAEAALNQLRIRTAGSEQKDDSFALLNKAQRSVHQLAALVGGGGLGQEFAAVWRRCVRSCVWSLALHAVAPMCPLST